MEYVTPPGGDPQAWLETDAIRRASDIALGVIALVVGVFALWYGAAHYAAGTAARLGPRAFPALAAELLCAVAIVLLVRAALWHSPPPVRRSRPLYVAFIGAVIVVLVFAHIGATPPLFGAPLFVRFGPAEFTALMALELAIAIALAHSSRARAAGMALLGLLLSTVGTDVNSGVLRFTMGVEWLSDGIGRSIVLLGLFVAGDALVCLVSPPLFLRAYAWLITAWRASRIPRPAALGMRLAAALALAGACYCAYALSHSYPDIALLLVFGILGVAAKIFGWNRFLLYIAYSLGPDLEENIRRAMLLSKGKPSDLMQRPISGTLLLAAIVVLGSVAVLSALRAANERQPHPAQAEAS